MTDYLKPRAGIHFRKSQLSESHVLVEAFETTLANSVIVDNTTAIPTAGNFSGTVLLTNTAQLETGRFSYAPDGCVAYCNGSRSSIWGGTEYRCAGFIIGDSANTPLRDYTKEMSNIDTGDSATIYIVGQATPECYVYVASTRPIKGVKLYVSGANTATSTVSGSYWASSTWTALTSVSDGTSSGTVTLAKTGSITFATTLTLAKPRMYNNVYAYWYRFVFTLMATACTVYYVTLDAEMQSIVDLWDGDPRDIMAYFKEKAFVGNYIDEITNVLKQDYVKGATSTYSDIGDLHSNEYLYFGFSEKMIGFEAKQAPAQVNITPCTIVVSYWNGLVWTSVGTVVDGTSDGTVSFCRSGIVYWDKPTTEVKLQIATTEPLYFYRINFSGHFNEGAWLDQITGISAQKTIEDYSYPVTWQNRLWLLDERQGKRNSAICTAPNSVCVFNGGDAIAPDSPFEFGGEEKITGGGTQYTRYGGTIYDNLLVFKESEVYLVDGTTPDNYKIYKISDTIGCIAPGTLKSCDISYEVAPGLQKHILIWQSDRAILGFDGNSIIPLSDDIGNYFDPVETECIPQAMMKKSEAFYDEALFEYHWLFASGTDQTTLNKEFVYDLRKKKWFEIDRGTGNYLQIGFPVRDIYGRTYCYGGIDTGYIERLEFGTTFDTATNITSQFRTGDIAFGGWNYETEIRGLNHICVSKSTTTNSITMTHYGDAIITSTQTATFAVKNTTNRVYSQYKSVNWTDNIFHSFSCSLITSNENIGYEPVGLGIRWRPIREKLL